jgi:pyrophosphatase PpaX
MSKITRLEAVLFDLDGTLYDSAHLDRESLRVLLDVDLGWEEAAYDIDDFLGVPSREVLERVAPHRVEELLSKWLDYQDELREQTHLFPRVRPTLEVLKESGLNLGVVTSQNKSELDATRPHIKLDDLIQVWVSASQVENPKPHAEPVLKALGELACRPENAIFIGDSVTDIQAGRSAGTRVAAVLWGLGKPEDWISLEPDYVFEQVSGFQRLIKI